MSRSARSSGAGYRCCVLAVLVFVLFTGLGLAAPGVPWNYDLWHEDEVSPTPRAVTVTLENVTVAHLYYHFGAGITATAWIVVDEGWDGCWFYQQSASAETDYDTAASGAITLTAIYPDVTVAVSTTAGTISGTVGLWQR